MAEGVEGEAFVRELASLTQTDLAASDDLTGREELGGDLELEVQQGQIESNWMSTERWLQQLRGVLDLESSATTTGSTQTDIATSTDDSTSAGIETITETSTAQQTSSPASLPELSRTDGETDAQTSESLEQPDKPASSIPTEVEELSSDIHTAVERNNPSLLATIGSTGDLSSAAEINWFQAIAETQTTIQAWASDSQSAKATIIEVFSNDGQPPSDDRINTLINDLQTGKIQITTELRDSTDLKGYLAAYNQGITGENERIFVNRDWIEFGVGREMIRNALLEELGHAFDRRLRPNQDTNGDEGERFSRSIIGGDLNEPGFLEQSLEDDHSAILIDGEQLEVEFASLTFKRGYADADTTNYGLQTNSIAIKDPLSTTAIRFTSANPADVQFSGNNVAGQLEYTVAGAKTVVNG